MAVQQSQLIAGLSFLFLFEIGRLRDVNATVSGRREVP